MPRRLTTRLVADSKAFEPDAAAREMASYDTAERPKSCEPRICALPIAPVLMARYVGVVLAAEAVKLCSPPGSRT